MRPVLSAFFLFAAAAAAYAGQAEDLGRIVVTPSRLVQSSWQGSRSVTALDGAALRSSGWDNIVDRMAGLGGVDVRRRGVDGVQADVNIRGATFDQNTILIDGIPLNDPQTGHFNMDLPLTSSDIEKVEIVKGPVSSLYGANSFGGAVNIMTRKAAGRGADVYAEGGSFDYARGGLSVSYPAGPVQNRFSYEQSRSSGYRPQTRFDVTALSDAASVSTFLGTYDILFGYQVKKFGAGTFYSNLFPNEAESTDTRFFRIGGEAEAGDLKIRPSLYLRRHKDKFELDINRPGWQTNYSTTYIYGGGVGAALQNGFLDAAYGFDVSRDTIDSTGMQTHARTENGVYIEVSPKLSDRLAVNAALRQDYFSDFGLEYSPSIGASYGLSETVTARAAAGRSFRIPTFTDLYYSDSANSGNPCLRPESSWTYEAGARYETAWAGCGAAYFYRQSFDTIDWIRYAGNGVWRASNTGASRANGAELDIDVFPSMFCRRIPVEKIFFSYTALDIYSKHDYISKYALDYLKQQMTAGAQIAAGPLRNYWTVCYKKRVGGGAYVVADTKITLELARGSRMSCEAFLEITNLFNTSYEEQSGVPMPGRWIRSGAKMGF